MTLNQTDTKDPYRNIPTGHSDGRAVVRVGRRRHDNLRIVASAELQGVTLVAVAVDEEPLILARLRGDGRHAQQHGDCERQYVSTSHRSQDRSTQMQRFVAKTALGSLILYIPYFYIPHVKYQPDKPNAPIKFYKDPKYAYYENK